MENPIETTAQAHSDALFHRIGDPLFYFFLALGAGLILYGLLVKRGTLAGRRLATAGAALSCMMLAAWSQVGIDKERGFIADQERRMDAKIREIARLKGKDAALKMQYMYMPTRNGLFYMTLGNPSIAADYVWLTSLQYVSNSFRRGEKFEMLSRFHHTLIDLDPHWVDAQINGGKVLSALIDEREKSEQCFLYAIKHNPDSWKLLYEAGMLYVMPPSDPKKMAEFSRRAANYFELARAKKSCPPDYFKSLDDRIARLRLESGKEYYIQAEQLLYKNATDPSSPERLRDLSKGDWLRAHSMAQAAALSETAQTLRKRNGAYPKTIAEIVAQMANPQAFAQDAYAQPFDYDAASGEVSSHGANALRSIQAAGIVNTIIGYFRNEHGGRLPKDLIELREYVRTAQNPPFRPPSVMMLEAIGIELDPTKGPLGPWNYDAEKGQVLLPPECNAKELYAHIKEHFK